MKGFLPWLGGKHYMAKHLVPIIEATPHVCYVEPFMGVAHVFFHRRKPVRCEVLNDINGDLVNLFRVLKYHHAEFLRQFDWGLVSREEFYRLDRTPTDTLTDIQRAARFYYLQKLSHSGRNWSRAFRIKTMAPPQLNLPRIEKDLSAAHLRLARVHIENLSWAKVIRIYDHEHTFFYVDPPYYGVEDYYGKGLFKREEFEELADVLAGIRGKFLLSLNDRPEVREIFKRFAIRTVEQRYRAGSQSPNHVQQVTELLIMPEAVSAAADAGKSGQIELFGVRA